MSKHTGKIILGVVVVAILGAVFSGLINPQALQINQNNSQSPVDITPKPTGSQPFSGQLTINLVLRDALDPTESRTEATNLATNYYRKVADGFYALVGT